MMMIMMMMFVKNLYKKNIQQPLRASFIPRKTIILMEPKIIIFFFLFFHILQLLIYIFCKKKTNWYASCRSSILQAILYMKRYNQNVEGYNNVFQCVHECVCLVRETFPTYFLFFLFFFRIYIFCM